MKTPPSEASYSVGLLLAGLTALSWALLAIGLKFALNFASSGSIVWFRCMVAAALLSLYFVAVKPQQLSVLRSLPWLGVLAALGLAANYFGYMKGVELTTASNAQIMIQMAPLAFALVGFFYFKEQPSLTQTLGFVTAGLGFAFFYWDQLLAATLHVDQYIEGNLWLVMGALTWTFFASAQKVLLKRWTPQQLNLLIFSISTLALAPLVEWNELSQWSPWVYVLMIALGVNSLVAYVALGEAIQRIPASHVSLIIALNPLVTIGLVSWLTLSLKVTWFQAEPIAWRGFVGAGLVVLGVVLTVVGRNKTSVTAKA